MDKWIIGLVTVTLVGLPLLAPEAFILLSAIAWPVVYFFIWLSSFGFDPSRDIPVVFEMASRPDNVLLLALAAGFGLLRGGKGVTAMVLTWAPLIFVFHFATVMGIGVEMSRDKWIKQNYVETACHNTFTCYYEPKQGLILPSFTMDKIAEVGGKITNVQPWPSQSSIGQDQELPKPIF